MFKLAEFAGGLTGIIDKGSTATSVLRQMGSASLVAKIGMAAAASAAVALGYEILSIAKTYGEYRQQLARISAAEASLAEATKAAAGRYAEISQRTGVLVTNMRELDAAVESGALVFDQASAKYMSAAQAQAALAGAARATAAELAAVDASRMVAAFDAANTSAAETGKAITALADLLQNKTPQGAAAFALAMTTIEQSGKLSAAQVAQAWQEALGKLSTDDLAEARFILYEKQMNIRALADSYFEAIGITPHIVLQSNDTYLIKAMTEVGFGIALLPDWAIQRELKEGTLVALDKPEPRQFENFGPMFLARGTSSLVQEFVRFCEKNIRLLPENSRGPL